MKFLRTLEENNIGTDLNLAREYRENKQRAYQEGFNEFLNTAIPIKINNQEYFIHPNVNLYIDLTSNCNCNCLFCIAKTNYQRNRIECNLYLDKLETAIKKLKDFGIDLSVQIVGGEPTLDKKIFKVIDLIDKYKIKRPVLGTNGEGLTKDLICRINNSSIEYINLSRHHYNEITNKEIMNSNQLKTNIDLEYQIKKIESSISIRMQGNLISNYIDTYGEVMQYIAWVYHKFGIKNISLSQLTPLPRKNIYQNSIIDYVEQRQVDINSILEKVEQDSRFRLIKYRGGVACYYEIWEFTAYEKPITVLFKFSDNSWMVQADEKINYIPDLIFHTDGNLCGSWNKNIKRLL